MIAPISSWKSSRSLNNGNSIWLYGVTCPFRLLQVRRHLYSQHPPLFFDPLCLKGSLLHKPIFLRFLTFKEGARCAPSPPVCWGTLRRYVALTPYIFFAPPPISNRVVYTEFPSHSPNGEFDLDNRNQIHACLPVQTEEMPSQCPSLGPPVRDFPYSNMFDKRDTDSVILESTLSCSAVYTAHRRSGAEWREWHARGRDTNPWFVRVLVLFRNSIFI